MFLNRSLITLTVVAMLSLTACVAPPPRQRVVYREGYADAPPPPPQQAPPPPQDQPSGRYCHTCGTVRTIDQVEMRQSNTGGGAVLGAIIGGVIGNSFGRGGGRAAATAAGVVGGAVVGNNVEENNARAESGYAWRYRVELDDGRWATVTQYNNPGFHPGDRVYVQRDHLEFMR